MKRHVQLFSKNKYLEIFISQLRMLISSNQNNINGYYISIVVSVEKLKDNVRLERMEHFGSEEQEIFECFVC